MRNISDKTCRENQNTFYVQCIFSRKSCVYEIMWKNEVACQATHDNIIRRMCIACWITKATHTHTHTHTLITCNIYCFSITIVTRTRRNVAFIGTLSVLPSIHIQLINIDIDIDILCGRNVEFWNVKTGDTHTHTVTDRLYKVHRTVRVVCHIYGRSIELQCTVFTARPVRAAKLFRDFG